MPAQALAARCRLLLGLAVGSLLAGCSEDRSPFAISRARHPEYYAAARAVRPDQEPKPRAVVAAKAPEPEPATPPELTELSGPTIEVSPADESGGGHPLDVPAARLAGALSIDVNDPKFSERLDALFDGDTGSLSRTEDINPLILVLRLKTPVKLTAVRIFPSYSTYDWAVRADPEAPRLMVRGAADERWSRIDLEKPTETTEVRIEVRRLVRDNYVHVNEVELLVE
jgi:hypothetical protein